MTNLYEQIVKDGGFSIGSNGQSPKNGYMVSLPDYETVIPLGLLDAPMTMGIVSKYQEKITNNNQFVGAWVDAGKVYFDLSENIGDKEVAIETGKKRQQIGIFDLSTFETIRL